MTQRRYLPLSGLRAFEAAARHLSFSAAARELNVTHGAVSQQIRRLEAQTGLMLFQRHNRGVHLTEAGAALFPVLFDGFDRMAASLESLTRQSAAQRLSVTTTPYFAARWLIPRLSRWRRRSPDLEVELRPSLEMLDIAGGACDVAVRCGLPPWPGLEAELLLPIHLSPLCSPHLLAAAPELKAPGGLMGQTLIHARNRGPCAGRGVAVLAGGGRARPCPTRVPACISTSRPWRCRRPSTALAWPWAIWNSCRTTWPAGRLVQPFDLAVRHSFSYYLVYPTARAGADDLRSFIAWMRAEAA